MPPPHVAVAAALLMQAFPGLTPARVVNLLLTSTDDIGAPGIDAITGRGALNLAKAFAPSGAVSVPLGASFQSYAGNEIGVVGAAFGDAFQNSAAWTSPGLIPITERSLFRSRHPGDRPDLSIARAIRRLCFGATTHRPAASRHPSRLPKRRHRILRVIGELPQAAFRSEVSLGGGLHVASAQYTPVSLDTTDMRALRKP